MHEIKANLYPCRHCNESGTCTTGKDGASCNACAKVHELSKNQVYFGLSCAACNGIGQAEPKTERINKRIKPVLAVLTVLLLLGFIFSLALMQNPHFPEFLAFSGTLLGSITAYYFTNSKNT
ncbi:molecular chaperone DnaJ [Microbulbifer marinus]|uniref:molecular chaperone DnaJ n=1 Tax=Microbulbifer marinus TaxID=658218 RepID=UPI000B878808|nr:molecular chaperone DnaJ [Microbulbifer marinus]